MKKIVFSDVDGTLLNANHEITPLTQKAIGILADKNIPFVIISARSPAGIYPILQEYKIQCPIISYSGALILDENKNVIFHKGIRRANAKRILEYIENEPFDLSWCVYSLDEWIVKDKTDPRIIREEQIVNATSRQASIDTITDNEVNKILCICNPEQILETEVKLKAAFPQYSIVKSSEILLEIMENGITKATAIKQLCSMWNIDPKDTIAFGDNYNDVEMLETVGQGFLMGNAPEDLKVQIPNHTLDNDHDGIYYALMGIQDLL